MTDIPDDVYDQLREYLERACRGTNTVDRGTVLLALLPPRPQPEPAWQPGDVVLANGYPWLRRDDSAPGWLTASGSVHNDGALPANPDRIARAGRRVHPARFTEHAEVLRAIANKIEGTDTADTRALRTIAADLAGDSDE